MLSVIDEPTHEAKQTSGCEWLELWLRLKSSLGERGGAVVFDIDSTLVDGHEQPIRPAVKLFHLCLELGFVPCIVTARSDHRENQEHTTRKLRQLGLSKFERMYMMPASLQPTLENVSAYKRAARNEIKKSYKIVANIGDMWSDHVVFPLDKNDILRDKPITEACIFFPKHSDGEVCLKLPAIESP